MFETTGTLAIGTPVLTLVGLIALPLLWTVIAALWSRPARTVVPVARGSSATAMGAFEVGAREGLVAPIVAITCSVATLGLAIVLAVRLATSPRGHLLVQHVSQLVRLGQLDLAFDLALDARNATFAIVVAILAVASTLNTCWSTRPGTGVRLSWTGVATTGALLTCLGDGFAPILVGLGILSLGGWGLSRGGDPTPNAVALGGNVSILLGLVFLFWSLGGSFGPEGYDPDGAPRFVVVTTGPSSERSDPLAKAILTMTSHRGAFVSSDDADLPGEPIASPFSVAVDPGNYTLRIQGGAASADVVVPRIALASGRTHVLTPYGPTASLRVLDDQVIVPRPLPSGGAASVRAILAGRTIGGLRASAIVLLLVLGGALAHAHALASRRGHSAVALLLEALPAPYLALRLAPLVDPLGADGSLVIVLGAGSGLALAARAACADDGYRALRGVLAATVSVAVASVGLGETSGALVLACASSIATGAALAAVDARRDVRWLGVACAAAVGLLPGAGASSGYILTLTAALGSAMAGALTWSVFTAIVAGAIVLTAALAALAAFRVYDVILRSSARSGGASFGQGLVVVVMAVTGLVGGTALGAGTTPFGGNAVPMARRLAGMVWPLPTAALAPEAPRVVAIVAAALSILAATGGVLLARRVSLAEATPPWLGGIGRLYGVLGWTAQAAGQTASFLHRSVRAMDRDVIDDIPAAGRELVGRIFGRKSDSLVVGKHVDVEGPRVVQLRTVLLALMVGLLGFVVLSSFLLRG